MKLGNTGSIVAATLVLVMGLCFISGTVSCQLIEQLTGRLGAQVERVTR